MRKTITKFSILVFAGLLSLAAPFSVACAEEASNETKSENGAFGIKFQNAWDFMADKVVKDGDEGLTGFQAAFGENAKDFTDTTQRVPCGERMCNLKTHTCLRKQTRGTWSAIWRNALYNLGAAAETAAGVGVAVVGTAGSATGVGVGAAVGGAVVAADGIQNFSDTVSYKYACVKNEDVSKNEYKDWENAAGKGNVNTETRTVGGSSSSTTNELEEECYKAKEAKGEVKKYCVQVIAETNEVRVYNADDDGHGCEVIPVRWFNNKHCSFCALLGGAYKAADLITEESRNALAGPFATVTALGVLIWIAMKTLVFVSSMTKQDAAKFITELIKQSYKFMIAFFALLYYDDVFRYIIRPLLLAGLEFGQGFVNVTSLEYRFEELDVFDSKNMNSLPGDYQRNFENNFYIYNVYVQLEHLAYNVNLNFALLQTIGGGLVCLGWHYLIGLLGSWEIGLGLASIIYGVCFSAFGFFLCIAFVFYLFDAVVQLGIVGGLLPFLIASWPFKITSKYTSTGFKMLLNSIFTFMMMGILARVSMELISAGVSLNVESSSVKQISQIKNTDSANAAAEAEVENGGLQMLAEAMDNIDTERLKEMVNVLNTGFLLFMFASIMGFLLIARVNELVNRFASGGMKGSAPSLATMGASSIKGMGAKVTAPARQAVGKWADEKVRGATRRVVSGAIGLATLRPLRRKIRNAASSRLEKDKSKKQNREVNVGGGQSGQRPKRSNVGDME